MRPDLRAMLEEARLGVEQVLADLNTTPDDGVQDKAPQGETNEDRSISEKKERLLPYYIGLDGEMLFQSGNRSVYQYLLDTDWEPEANSQVSILLNPQAQEHYSARVMSCSEAILVFSTHDPLPTHWLKRALFREDRDAIPIVV